MEIAKMKRRTTDVLTKNLNSERYSTEEKKQIKGILDSREKKRKEISSILEKNQPKNKIEPKKEPKKSAPESNLKVVKNELNKKDKPVQKKIKPVKSQEKKEKKPGVIQTIFDSITDKPITEDELIFILGALFPDRQKKSMINTIKVQIAGKKRPTRMEREKNISFMIEEIEGVKYYSHL